MQVSDEQTGTDTQTVDWASVAKLMEGMPVTAADYAAAGSY